MKYIVPEFDRDEAIGKGRDLLYNFTIKPKFNKSTQILHSINPHLSDLNAS